MRKTVSFASQPPRRWKVIRRLVALTVALLLIPTAYVATKYVAVRRFDAKFNTLEPGDSVDAVVSLLGQPDQIRRGQAMFLLVGRRERADGFQYLYFIDTFYLPLGWVIEFDARSSVVHTGKLD